MDSQRKVPAWEDDSMEDSVQRSRWPSGSSITFVIVRPGVHVMSGFETEEEQHQD